jgi:hypothetical protein
MMSRFREAVSFATEWLGSTDIQRNSAHYAAEPTLFLYLFGLPVEHRFDDHPHCGSMYILDDESLKWLHLRSAVDRGAYDLLVTISVTRLLRHEPLPHPISFFAGTVLAGLAKPPASEGSRLTKNFTANVHLVFLAQKLADGFGLHLTRNDESSVEESACDAVSLALAALGINKTPRAIKELLVHKSALRVREIVQAMQDFHRQQSKVK